jgi:hypothetical protein
MHRKNLRGLRCRRRARRLLLVADNTLAALNCVHTQPWRICAWI